MKRPIPRRAENYVGECRHPNRRPGEGRDPRPSWIPAFAGKTRKGTPGSSDRRFTTLTRATLVLLAALLGLSAWGGTAAAMQIQPVTGASGGEAWLGEDHSVPVASTPFPFPGGAGVDPAGKGRTASTAAS